MLVNVSAPEPQIRSPLPVDRMRQALQRVRSDGLAPVAIYGSGRHTGQVLPALLDSPVPVACFVDDRPERRNHHVLGWEIVAPEAVSHYGVKAIILNSQAYEDALWQRREIFESRGIRVLRLYGEPLNTAADDVKSIEAAMDGAGQLSCSQLQTFWSTRGAVEAQEADNPEDYATSVKGVYRSLLLSRWLAEAGVSTDETILEVGCNVGRNLAVLRSCGYRQLTGVEINPNALSAMQTFFPVTAREARLFNGSLENVLPTLPDKSQSLVFAMAVLEHIHPDSEDLVFNEMVRVAKRFILTIEDEDSLLPRHFPRNYARIFEARRCRQVSICRFADLDEEFQRMYELNTKLVARLFSTPA